jgi:cytochrome c-type biogenesis protein CcmH/NrfG
MPNLATDSATRNWTTVSVYSMAGACLLIGLALGYLFRGSEVRSAAAVPAAAATAAPSVPAGHMQGQRPTLEQMKKMADTKAGPLLEQLKSDPNNVKLLVQVAGIYSGTHQFNEAVPYYNRALAADPKNVAVRTEMASCLYYAGDIDGALGQLQQALSYDPKNANALFNLGMIRWKGKNDAAGAIAAWQTLLKTNPKLDRKPVVEKMIAEAKLGAATAAAERSTN